MKYRQEIHQYVQAHKEPIVQMLKELVKIPSVRGKAVPGAPFGADSAAVLTRIRALYTAEGLAVEPYIEDGYLLTRYGHGERSIGLFAHADVVPVQNDWQFTAPFEPLEKEGYLIGRGVMDDKSAVVISLYCVKLFRELNIPLDSRLVLYTGSAEESGMEDIDRYVQAHTPPDFSLVADTAFPLYRGCKSALTFTLEAPCPFERVSDFRGGHAVNVTVGEAAAELDGRMWREAGVSRHSALPQGSQNGGALLAARLCESIPATSPDAAVLRFAATLMSDCYGRPFGIDQTDPDFGPLTCSNVLIRTVEGRLQLTFNARFGTRTDVATLKRQVGDTAARAGWRVSFEPEKIGYLTPAEHPCVQACRRAWSEFSGNPDPTVYLNAGGTYGRKLPCAVEIGTTTRGGAPAGMPAGHGQVHQPDECISIEGLLEAVEVTAHMILACDRALS